MNLYSFQSHCAGAPCSSRALQQKNKVQVRQQKHIYSTTLLGSPLKTAQCPRDGPIIFPVSMSRQLPGPLSQHSIMNSIVWASKLGRAVATELWDSPFGVVAALSQATRHAEQLGPLSSSMTIFGTPAAS